MQPQTYIVSPSFSPELVLTAFGYHDESDEVLLFGKHFGLSMNNDVHPYLAPFVLDAWMDGEVWCLPVTFVAQVELYSDQSVVCGQPRARVQTVHLSTWRHTWTAKHQVRTVLNQNDGASLICRLGSREHCRQVDGQAWLFPVTGSSSGDPNSFLCAVQHVSRVIHALLDGSFFFFKKKTQCFVAFERCMQYALQIRPLYSNLKSCIKLAGEILPNSSVFKQCAIVSRGCRVVGPFVFSLQTETYDGKSNSCGYDNLAAIVASILLLPEGRSSGVHSNTVTSSVSTY